MIAPDVDDWLPARMQAVAVGVNFDVAVLLTLGAQRIKRSQAEIDRQREVIRRVNAKCDHFGRRLGEVIKERDALMERVGAVPDHQGSPMPAETPFPFLDLIASHLRMPEDIRALKEMIMSLTDVTNELTAKVAALEASVEGANSKADLLITAHADIRAQLVAALAQIAAMGDVATAETAIKAVIARVDSATAALTQQAAENTGALDFNAPPVG